MEKDKESDQHRILEAVQLLPQEASSSMKRKKRKGDTRIWEAIQVLQQQSCSMQKQIKELEGNKQQEAQGSPSAPSPPPPRAGPVVISTAKYKLPQKKKKAKYKLVIRSEVSEIVHIGRPIGTKEGNGIEVTLEDLHGNQVAAGHPLASLKVELVVLRGEFYDGKGVRDWTKKDFEKNIIKPNNQKEKIKSAIFQLTDGKGVHEGTTINKSSNKKLVKLGVKVCDDHCGERVLEGVSNSFVVQHLPRGQKSPGSSPSPQNSPVKNRRGDDPNMDNSFSFPNAQRDNGLWDLSGHDLLFHSLQVDESGRLAQGITSLIPSIRGIVPPGYKALLDKIQQLETRLPAGLRLLDLDFIKSQEQVRKIDDLKGCLQVVGDTIVQLTMDLTSILRHEGPAKILFHNLQRLQRTLVEKVSLEMAKLEMVGLTTSSVEAQYGLGGSRGNGTDDQTIDGNSHGIAYTQPMNSQNTPHGMQSDPSAEADHHTSLLGQMMGNGTDDQNIDGNSHGIAYTQPMNTPHGMQSDPRAEAHHHTSLLGQMMDPETDVAPEYNYVTNDKFPSAELPDDSYTQNDDPAAGYFVEIDANE